MNRPTPITDAAIIHEVKAGFVTTPALHAGKEIVHAHVARELETELADTKATLAKLQESFNKAMDENLRLRSGVSAPVVTSALA